MKILKSYIIILFALFLFSCNDFLDPDPKDRLSETLFWQNEESTNLYLNSLYPYITDFGNFGSSQFNSGLLTEGMTSMLKYGSYSAGRGNANLISFNPFFVTADQTQGLVIWSSTYSKIRKVNEFLDGLERYSKYTDEVNNAFEAQARFVRAFLNYQLLLRTNQIIIQDKLPTTNDNPLNSTKESWDFVEKDLDFAIDNLPLVWPSKDNGRITKGAALAMKSRAMLVAERWEKSRDAANKVIALNKDNELIYKLNSQYSDAFKSHFNGNPESILEFRYSLPAPYHSFDRKFAPGGDWENNGGDATPTQEMVEEYELANVGGWPDWSKWRSKTTQTPPYELLEPRFHASILYNGANWKGRKIESYVDGMDGYIDYGFQPNTYGKTTTGYYLKKYLDEDLINISSTYSSQPWIEIRLAEVYLNLAEASAMLGSQYEQEANDAIRTIRSRVGLPYQNNTGESLIDAIRHERKVELAFEGFHYWDLRRWRIAHNELEGVRFHGLKIEKTGSGFTYEYIDVDKTDRHFPERFYNFPIPSNEIANNRALSQINQW